MFCLTKKLGKGRIALRSCATSYELADPRLKTSNGGLLFKRKGGGKLPPPLTRVHGENILYLYQNMCWHIMDRSPVLPTQGGTFVYREAGCTSHHSSQEVCQVIWFSQVPPTDLYTQSFSESFFCRFFHLSEPIRVRTYWLVPPFLTGGYSTAVMGGR